MFKKIKNFVANIKRKIMFAICLSDMEYQGKAAFGLCNGYIDKECLECPYFVDNNKKKRDKKVGEG